MEMTKKRIIRLEPSPYASTRIKMKRAVPKTNSAGYAIKDMNGKLATVEQDLNEAVQVPGTSITIAPSLTPSGLKTGQEGIVDNPYSDLPAYHPEWGERVLKGKEKISLQHVLEYKHGVDFNHYSGNHMDRIIASDKISEQPFFLTDKCKLRLDGSVYYLNLDNPLHEVWYYLALSKPIVANSYADLDEGRNTRAKYYIADLDEIKDIKLDKIRKKNKAVAALEDLNSKSESTIINMSLALGFNDRSPNKDKAYKYIHKTMNSTEEDFATFMKYYDMYKDKNRRDYFLGASLVQEMLNYSILRNRDNKFFWIMPETDDKPMRTFEWSSKDRLITDFINAPEYKEELKIMKSILESRK